MYIMYDDTAVRSPKAEQFLKSGIVKLLSKNYWVFLNLKLTCYEAIGWQDLRVIPRCHGIYFWLLVSSRQRYA